MVTQLSSGLGKVKAVRKWSPTVVTPVQIGPFPHVTIIFYGDNFLPLICVGQTNPYFVIPIVHY